MSGFIKTPLAGAASPGLVRVVYDTDIDLLQAAVNDTVVRQAVCFDGVERLTAAKTLTAAENGKSVLADSATSIPVTLPLAVPGMRFKLVTGTVTASGGHNFAPNAADTIVGAGLSKSAGQAVTNSAATDVVGDLLELTCFQATQWVITAIVGTWA